MYRPTVRYADCYQQYVDEIFLSTTLDRNQIIRAALFTAAHSEEFLKLMKQNQKADVPLPSPLWELDNTPLWREQSPKTKGEERDVNDHDDRKGEVEDYSRVVKSGTYITNIEGRHHQVQGSERSVPERIKTTGEIKIRIG
ncbi:hypothetical protein LC048_20865 [Mesobacillus subterraneus]|uniref:hypothetical protein n=1 Tax=Mesobacillus subterraneus TaxID=285983 RepID=UPI001CFDA44B|nr:hypothetical protein [Mesobacillus subterraneus]WLR54820.1 hypothetical protein LC048_20865 [Mesobacillus subterraneus]